MVTAELEVEPYDNMVIISAVIWQKGFNDIFEDFDIFAGKLLLWLELTLYEVVWPYHVSKPLFEHPLLS